MAVEYISVPNRKKTLWENLSDAANAYVKTDEYLGERKMKKEQMDLQRRQLANQERAAETDDWYKRESIGIAKAGLKDADQEFLSNMLKSKGFGDALLMENSRRAAAKQPAISPGEFAIEQLRTIKRAMAPSDQGQAGQGQATPPQDTGGVPSWLANDMSRVQPQQRQSVPWSLPSLTPQTVGTGLRNFVTQTGQQAMDYFNPVKQWNAVGGSVKPATNYLQEAWKAFNTPQQQGY